MSKKFKDDLVEHFKNTFGWNELYTGYRVREELLSFIERFEEVKK